jgi:hypothetical protein
MATPLIRIPQEQGGTMYAFSSAARDLTRAYYNPDINFEYSKFALIDIPVVSDPGVTGANFIQFENLYQASGDPYNTPVTSSDANVHFAQTLQNYALNFENFILTDDDFDSAIYSTDAEKILFKWLHHLGAFEVKTANSQQVVSGYSRAIENEDTTDTGNSYSRVVKYIGNIDVSNDKNYQGNTYNEIFVNVPSSVGYTPEILFKSTPYNTTATSYDVSLGTGVINGRGGQTHPDAFLNLDALADNANGKINIDPVDLYNYGIEWNSTVYSKIANDPKLNNFQEFSKRGGDFRFNAILVYYDLYSKSNISNKSTNLYGILILDNFKDDPASSGMYIPELSKYKPNDVTGLNGNAFALKLNVKFNSSLDNVGVEMNINDYSTFSMDIFLDTTTALENAAKLLVDAGNSYAAIAQRVAELENLMAYSTSTDFSERISSLETTIENASLNYASSTSILDMITSVNTRLNQMISGVIPTEIQYNTNVLAAGDGVKIDKSNPSMIKIVNDNNGYTLNSIFNYEFIPGISGSLIAPSNLFNLNLAASTGLITRIRPFENLIRINTDNNTMTGDLNIYLDDSINTWKNGQTIKFSFKNQIPIGIPTLGNYKINIYTDKNNSYVLKASIDSSNILSQKPYFELICVDEINKTFELEIIR